MVQLLLCSRFDKVEIKVLAGCILFGGSEHEYAPSSFRLLAEFRSVSGFLLSAGGRLLSISRAARVSCLGPTSSMFNPVAVGPILLSPSNLSDLGSSSASFFHHLSDGLVHGSTWIIQADLPILKSVALKL